MVTKSKNYKNVNRMSLSEFCDPDTNWPEKRGYAEKALLLLYRGTIGVYCLLFLLFLYFQFTGNKFFAVLEFVIIFLLIVPGALKAEETRVLGLLRTGFYKKNTAIWVAATTGFAIVSGVLALYGWLFVAMFVGIWIAGLCYLPVLAKVTCQKAPRFARHWFSFIPYQIYAEMSPAPLMERKEPFYFVGDFLDMSLLSLRDFRLDVRSQPCVTIFILQHSKKWIAISSDERTHFMGNVFTFLLTNVELTKRHTIDYILSIKFSISLRFRAFDVEGLEFDWDHFERLSDGAWKYLEDRDGQFGESFRSVLEEHFGGKEVFDAIQCLPSEIRKVEWSLQADAQRTEGLPTPFREFMETHDSTLKSVGKLQEALTDSHCIFNLFVKAITEKFLYRKSFEVSGNLNAASVAFTQEFNGVMGAVDQFTESFRKQIDQWREDNWQRHKDNTEIAKAFIEHSDSLYVINKMLSEQLTKETRSGNENESSKIIPNPSSAQWLRIANT